MKDRERARLILLDAQEHLATLEEVINDEEGVWEEFARAFTDFDAMRKTIDQYISSELKEKLSTIREERSEW